MLFSTQILGEKTKSEEVWKVGDTYLALIARGHLLYSESCENFSCEALKVASKLSLKNLKTLNTSGGKNPGATLCAEHLKEILVTLKDLRGNENSFCLFKDQSFISSHSLYQSALSNKN